MTGHAPPAPHPYLRAYMAGIAIPTMLFVMIPVVFLASHPLHHVPMPIERVLVFPATLGPNLWGLWNVLYVAVRRRRPWPIGVHGALLTLVVGPIAWTVATSFGVPHVTIETAGTVFPFVVVVYYLLWKHGVCFLNELLGVG
jgi:hypothetical protein